MKCAICKGSSFGIDQRFMQADGEWRGVCKKCFYSFPLYTDMEFYLRTQPDVPYRLKEISCTACNHRGVSLDFRATMSVRESIYFVTCGGCKRQFRRAVLPRSVRITRFFFEPLVYTLTMSENPKQPKPSEEPEQPKARKEIPLISVPNDRDMIAEEMEELFEEDKVSHQHGSSEPEAD